MPNYNEWTGIPYGVLSGNNVPELLDAICRNGDNLSYAAFKAEIEASLRGAIISALGNYTHRAEKVAEGIDYSALMEGLFDSCLAEDWLAEDWQGQEEEFEYEYETEDGPVKLLLGWLGGAPLIWVCDSPYVAECAQCSPCIPGAGDLDTPRDDGDDGGTAYCLPPDDMPEGWGGVARRVTTQVTTQDTGD